MKNFPHQYNDLRKLRATLETVRDLNDAGSDAEDDEVLGYELARRRIYGFRPPIDESGGDNAIARRIEERLELERAKRPSDQGPQTAARDMRSTLRYLGWLQQRSTSLTAPGETLLDTHEGSDDELLLIQQAISNIAVADRDLNVSHPVQLLLRLIDEVPMSSRKGMELVLEAADDSAAEYRRIVTLARLPEAERVEQLKSRDWTDSQLKNAVKILPALALQADLMRDGGDQFILTDAGRRALGRAVVTTSQKRPGGRASRRQSRRRQTTVQTRNPSEVGRSQRLRAAERRVLTSEEQAAAAELLYERTERHQELVRTTAAACRKADFYEDAAAYDLVIEVDRAQPLVLTEVKTIAGDAAVQIRAAMGQILFYEHFAVAEQFPERSVRRLVVVDEQADEALAAFLQAHDVGLIAVVDDEIVALNALGENLRRDLFE